MERKYIAENNRERERLMKLVHKITDEELKLVIYKEGWTVAVALGHLAFWDERRLALVKNWLKNGVTLSDINGLDMNTTNDALVPLFLAMPVRKVAELAVLAAERVDKEVANLPDDILPKIEALGDRASLNRGAHRKMHLDEIEAFLKSKRG
jgi:hypothetical protein